MFFAEGQIPVHLYGEPADMRKSYDGLQALTRHAMGRDPLDGGLYISVIATKYDAANERIEIGHVTVGADVNPCIRPFVAAYGRWP